MRAGTAKGTGMIGYRRHGDGPVKVIVLHGWFGDSHSFDAILPALDPGVYSLALIDYRGYGTSKDQAGPFAIATIADDAADLVEALGWTTYAILGHSMGGKAALALAVKQAERVSRILALTPVWAGPGLDTEALAFFRQAVTDIDARIAILRQSLGNGVPIDTARRMAAASQEVSTVDAFGGYLESWAVEDFADQAAALRQEVLVVAGAEDGGVTPDIARATWLAGLSNARLEIMAACGHYPMVERPSELVRLVDAFLAQGEAHPR